MPPVFVYLRIVESSWVFTGGWPNIARLGMLNAVSQMVILGVGQLADDLVLCTEWRESLPPGWNQDIHCEREGTVTALSACWIF